MKENNIIFDQKYLILLFLFFDKFNNYIYYYIALKLNNLF
jgi:hypothetical protein